jgi:glutaminase
MIVVPNAMGIALWSPPVDEIGNSCRGVQFCRGLIEQFNFHNYDNVHHDPGSAKIDPRRRGANATTDSVITLLFAAKAGDLNVVRRYAKKVPVKYLILYAVTT